MHRESTLLTEANKSKLRKIIGQLRWVTDQSRADGAYDELILSIQASKPTVGTFKRALRSWIRENTPRFLE